GIDIAAEDIRIPKLSMLGLSGDGLPHVPRFAAAVVNDRQVRGMSLVAVTGSIGAAAVGNEDEIILDQVDGLLLTVFYIDDLLCDLLITFGLYNDIFYIHTVLDLHAMILKIFYQRQDHALVLVVFGETQGAEIRQAVNMMHIAAEI